KLLDDLVAKSTPSSEDLKNLRDIVPNNPLAFEYFFSKIGDGWLEPLHKKGFFTRPPALENGSFSFWPESRYLARIADTRSQMVLKIILALPDTQNPYVHDDLCDAALKMPVEQALQIVP